MKKAKSVQAAPVEQTIHDHVAAKVLSMLNFHLPTYVTKKTHIAAEADDAESFESISSEDDEASSSSSSDEDEQAQLKHHIVHLMRNNF
jgi:hypothetical protein